jgi:hypothetical protein
MDADELPSAAAGGKAPASSASCYISAGWGITFDPADFAKFKAIKPCPANTYGVANETFGLINAPCKACTKNLYSLAASTNFTACLNPGGFGYTSEGANQVRASAGLLLPQHDALLLPCAACCQPTPLCFLLCLPASLPVLLALLLLALFWPHTAH